MRRNNRFLLVCLRLFTRFGSPNCRGLVKELVFPSYLYVSEILGDLGRLGLLGRLSFCGRDGAPDVLVTHQGLHQTI